MAGKIAALAWAKLAFGEASLKAGRFRLRGTAKRRYGATTAGEAWLPPD